MTGFCALCNLMLCHETVDMCHAIQGNALLTGPVAMDIFTTPWSADPNSYLYPAAEMVYRGRNSADKARSLYLVLGQDIRLSFSDDATRHSGNEFLKISIQTMAAVAHPNGQMLTPFGVVDYVLDDVSAHGIKRGAVIESALANTPLPIMLAHADHAGWDKHFIYHTMCMVDRLPLVAQLQAPLFLAIQELGGPITLYSVYTKVASLSNDIRSLIMLREHTAAMQLANTAVAVVERANEQWANIFQVVVNQTNMPQLRSGLLSLAPLLTDITQRARTAHGELGSWSKSLDAFQYQAGQNVPRFLPDQSSSSSVFQPPSLPAGAHAPNPLFNRPEVHAATASFGFAGPSALPAGSVPASLGCAGPSGSQSAGHVFSSAEVSQVLGNLGSASVVPDPPAGGLGPTSKKKMPVWFNCGDRCGSLVCMCPATGTDMTTALQAIRTHRYQIRNVHSMRHSPLSKFQTQKFDCHQTDFAGSTFYWLSSGHPPLGKEEGSGAKKAKASQDTTKDTKVPPALLLQGNPYCARDLRPPCAPIMTVAKPFRASPTVVSFQSMDCA